MKTFMLGVKHCPMHKVKQTMADRLFEFCRLCFIAGIVIEIKSIFRRPAEIILELLPVISDFSGPAEYLYKCLIIRHASDIGAGSADGPIHSKLLSGSFDVLVNLLAAAPCKKLIADETARQFYMVHQ